MNGQAGTLLRVGLLGHGSIASNSPRRGLVMRRG